MSDHIEAVVVREQGRPRWPKDTSTIESAYRGSLVTDPAAVLGEMAHQVETEASPRVTDSLANLRETCPWRMDVAPHAPYVEAMLSRLLSPYGRSLFGTVVMCMPDKSTWIRRDHESGMEKPSRSAP